MPRRIPLLSTGVPTGLAAAVLTRLLESTERHAWHGSGADLLASAPRAGPAATTCHLLERRISGTCLEAGSGRAFTGMMTISSP